MSGVKAPEGMTIRYGGVTGVHAWFSVSVSKCVTHASPVDGGGVTPCCGVTPFELPKWDRITLDPSLVTCDPSLVTCGPAA